VAHLGGSFTSSSFAKGGEVSASPNFGLLVWVAGGVGSSGLFLPSAGFLRRRQNLSPLLCLGVGVADGRSVDHMRLDVWALSLAVFPCLEASIGMEGGVQLAPAAYGGRGWRRRQEGLEAGVACVISSFARVFSVKGWGCTVLL